MRLFMSGGCGGWWMSFSRRGIEDGFVSVFDGFGVRWRVCWWLAVRLGFVGAAEA